MINDAVTNWLRRSHDAMKAGGYAGGGYTLLGALTIVALFSLLWGMA